MPLLPVCQVSHLVLTDQVLAGVTSSCGLAVVQAKEGDLWEPTTEAELDHMEAEGIQQPLIQAQTIALEGPLADGAMIRQSSSCIHSTTPSMLRKACASCMQHATRW